VDALTAEIEQLRPSRRRYDTAEGRPSSGLGPAASKVYGLTHGISLGGLHEMFMRTSIASVRTARHRPR
jgi:hypothetical protein